MSIVKDNCYVFGQFPKSFKKAKLLAELVYEMLTQYFLVADSMRYLPHPGFLLGQYIIGFLKVSFTVPFGDLECPLFTSGHICIFLGVWILGV